MKPRGNSVHRARSKGFQAEGPNWVLIAGGALLSTLSIRLGYKLKQVLDTKEADNSSNISEGSGKANNQVRSGNQHLHSNSFCFSQEDGGCYNCFPGSGGMAEMKQPCDGQMVTGQQMALPLVTVTSPDLAKENGVIWASSPDRLELPQKPFHHSNSSDSPCVSESGSEIFSKREVIQKLRQQLKRRDDMILEMQEQIVELQNSLNAQVSHSAHLQSLLDVTNRDLFDSEREIQRLRKAIADHCVGQMDSCDKPPTVPVWTAGGRTGNAHVHLDVDGILESMGKVKGEEERIELLKREVCDLKEVIEGKEFLLQSYKEQKVELSMKIRELQQRLDSQLPNIL